MAASFVVVYTVFFPTTRLIAPAMFIAMFYAGVACARLLSQPMDSISAAQRQQ